MFAALPLKIKVVVTEFMTDDFPKGLEAVFFIKFRIESVHPWGRNDLQWSSGACSTRLDA